MQIIINELKNAIERFLSSRARELVDYLILDDGSTDGTTEMICSFKEQGVQTIKHPQRRGVGAAIRTAIMFAREKGYDVIVIMAGNDKGPGGYTPPGTFTDGDGQQRSGHHGA